ncbi:MAG: nucleotidyltransferase family protein [Thiomicrospira sp.]|jgi:MurNAc alpha-1-phosphate uridylyltransferase
MIAMILAAGRGERLRPLTDDCPKPLMQVGERCLIEYHLLKLAQQGVACVVINHAWLGDKIEAALGCGSRYGLKIEYSAEPEGGLETAGGIIQALPKLGDRPFWVINADVFSALDFAQLPRDLAEGSLAHLMLVPTPSFKPQGDFGLTPAGRVTAQGEWTFSGFSLLSPALFDGLAPGRRALAPLLREAMAQGAVTGEVYQGYWSDIGTLSRLEAARNWLKNGAAI